MVMCLVQQGPSRHDQCQAAFAPRASEALQPAPSRARSRVISDIRPHDTRMSPVRILQAISGRLERVSDLGSFEGGLHVT